MKYKHIDDPKALREQENAQAQACQNQANIDFIALMVGVDLGEEDEDEQSI